MTGSGVLCGWGPESVHAWEIGPVHNWRIVKLARLLTLTNTASVLQHFSHESNKGSEGEKKDFSGGKGENAGQIRGRISEPSGLVSS